jgi:D-alanyl-D-alanine endopeptidase (penicillin-binding protein 7)
MMAQIASRPVVIVLLDSVGKYTRLVDAARIKYWLETGGSLPDPKATVKAPAKAKARTAGKKPLKTASAPKYASAAATRMN